jgi:hypothetical protein
MISSRSGVYIGCLENENSPTAKIKERYAAGRISKRGYHSPLPKLLLPQGPLTSRVLPNAEPNRPGNVHFPRRVQRELSDGPIPSVGVSPPRMWSSRASATRISPQVRWFGQPEFQRVSSRKLLKSWLFVLAGVRQLARRDVERLLSTQHFDTSVPVFQVAQRGVGDTKNPGVVRERSVVLEINRTDVQPFHFGVEGVRFILGLLAAPDAPPMTPRCLSKLEGRARARPPGTSCPEDSFASLLVRQAEPLEPLRAGKGMGVVITRCAGERLPHSRRCAAKATFRHFAPESESRYGANPFCTPPL